MISSTALDLPEHREQVRDACLHEGVFPIGMEQLPARDASGIRVSLEMVDQADIYIGVYAWRYGWVPDFDNPGKISITEMEFNHALERKQRGELKEILIFVMHDEHSIRACDKEDGNEAQRKLKKFKKRASAGRVMLKFKSKEELRGQVIQSLADLKRRFGGSDGQKDKKDETIPKPPAFYAEPDYIGSQKFVGRESQLLDLNDWAKAADPTNLLLFDAIGGNGKSALTWEWTNNHAIKVRTDWAGRFWYSFYERGAVMADFCRRALSYMTGRPLEELDKMRTPELAKDLLAQLHSQPWLLILDGLERVLVAYHRIDAAEVPDEQANAPTDKMLNRNPCDTIRDEDGDLLRALAGARPSKILVSSRLTPRVLLNPAGQPIPGARRITLPGLRPDDAEKLLRSSDITGDSVRIQDYLTQNCDNHPLVIGVLAGLIANYLPDRGNFDAWVADTGPQGGAKLNLATLDLTQKRNHILRAALDALPEKRRQLLSTLALLSESVDYKTLAAFNPHMPLEPEEVNEPRPPEEYWRWEEMTDEEKAVRREQYEAALSHRKDYEQAVKAWQESAELREAPGKLAETIRDLEQRGLLQYDGRTRRYDLHPVVRGVAAGTMKAEDKECYGHRVVDHFSSVVHNSYEQAKTLEDLAPGLHVVRTLLRLGKYEDACHAYRGDLSRALVFNLNANPEILALVRPFFDRGWNNAPSTLQNEDDTFMLTSAARSLQRLGELPQALDALAATLPLDIERGQLWALRIHLIEIGEVLCAQHHFAIAERVNHLGTALGSLNDDSDLHFRELLDRFELLARMGRWEDAQATWLVLNPMGRNWWRAVNRSRLADCVFVRFLFWQRRLDQESLINAEHLALAENNYGGLSDLQRLSGAWWLERGEWALAVASFYEAVRMARERRLLDVEAEAGLALAKFQLGKLGQPIEARQEAERLAAQRKSHHRYLAMLWRAIGEPAQAEKHALAAYKWAWADGEPYVNRYELTKTTELLQEMNIPIPVLSPYDPAKDEPPPWEADVRAAIEKLRAEKEANEKAEKQNPD